jgi:hypothetical protein
MVSNPGGKYDTKSTEELKELLYRTQDPQESEVIAREIQLRRERELRNNTAPSRSPQEESSPPTREREPTPPQEPAPASTSSPASTGGTPAWLIGLAVVGVIFIVLILMGAGI